jgi:hypothetical protein
MKKEEKLEWEREGETKNKYEGVAAVVCGCMGERTLVLVFYQSPKWTGFHFGPYKKSWLRSKHVYNTYLLIIYI